jgi:hypothetical protein
MPLKKKDADKNSDRLYSEKKDMSKAQVRKAKTDKAVASKNEREAGPVKKVVNKVKKTLPKTSVYEDKGEFQERQTAGKPRSRKEYVSDKKRAGQKVKPRFETKKGWGSNAPVKKRKLDE